MAFLNQGLPRDNNKFNIFINQSEFLFNSAHALKLNSALSFSAAQFLSQQNQTVNKTISAHASFLFIPLLCTHFHRLLINIDFQTYPADNN